MKNYTDGADLRLSGYASLFGEADLQGDIVRRGAFAASLLKHGGAGLPMLMAHDTSEPIGVWERIFEDRSGLFVSGRILAGSARADRAIALVRSGAISGLSIGYKTRRAAPRRSGPKGGGRLLSELDLWEVSVVAFPMLRSARLTQIGDLSTPELSPQISKRSPL